MIAAQKTPDGKRAHTLWHSEHPRKVWDDSECEYAFLGIFEQVYNLVPDLAMTWCHLTDSRVVPSLLDMGERVAIELAVHYAFIRENDTHGKNHHVSRPPAKLLRDIAEIRRLMVSGLPRIINGLDDAPWPIESKECAAAMCGIWNLPVALPLIIQVFEEEGGLKSDPSDKNNALVSFLAGNAANFYNLQVSESTITLKKNRYIGQIRTRICRMTA